MEAPHLACESSLETGEPLYATTSRVDVWMLLEYNAAWGAKALPESDLPNRVKSFLNEQQANIPNARFQFIKQTNRSTEGIRFYIARSNLEKPTLYRIDLTTYGDLVDLDIPAIASGQQLAPVDESLFIVCTNGKRDTCCALHGLPLYRAMLQYAGEAVWETTHIGGHRFAGTMTCLPQGLCYGRVRPEQASAVVNAYRRGEILLEHYRGSSTYDAPVQAADYFLRQQIDSRKLTDLQFRTLETLSENHWRITFTDPDNHTHTTEICSAPSTFELYESTRNTEKSQVIQYRLA